MFFSATLPPQLVQGWTAMTFLSCSTEHPSWNPQFGGQEHYFRVSTKNHLKPFAVKSARKMP
jgi:hypothetical protein